VHRSYLKPIRALIDAGVLKGAAHITGGGITDNTPRILAAWTGGASGCIQLDCSAVLRGTARDREYRLGRLPADVQPGVGMIVVVSKRNLGKAREILGGIDEKFFELGSVVKARGARVEYVGGER
jgi:phosphoribosylformylglycinamidine cyclo-ligase